MVRTILGVLSALLLFSLHLPAQAKPDADLIAITRGIYPASGVKIVRQNMAGCKSTACKVSIFS